MDEKSQIIGLRQGNKDSFTALYNRYWNQVYRFSLLYVANKDTADEVVQEVFVKLWDARACIHENENLKGLLFIITRNLIFNKFRKKVNEEFYRATVVAAMQSSYSIEEEIEAKNLQEYIDRLIAELPPRRREIFILSRKEQKSYKEIAALLHISERTVENQIREALLYLKKNMTLLLLFL